MILKNLLQGFTGFALQIFFLTLSVCKPKGERHSFRSWVTRNILWPRQRKGAGVQIVILKPSSLHSTCRLKDIGEVGFNLLRFLECFPVLNVFVYEIKARKFVDYYTSCLARIIQPVEEKAERVVTINFLFVKFFKG